MEERFGLRCLAVAGYPMYRGLARLVGMDSASLVESIEGQLAAVEGSYREHDFIFLHMKEPDSRGEDGDFLGKVRALEGIDALLPRLTALEPDVLVVTGDHSTPSKLASHSWHPVPVLLHSPYSRPDGVDHFDEVSCAAGSLGLRPTLHLMSLALANAQRLTKYGA
jgi:2,3-bisphosphoglycerate-independent phosphoglycerate mutase